MPRFAFNPFYTPEPEWSSGSYGAFANLDFGVEGLIHATEMPLEEGQSPRDILSEGQQVQLRVLHVDARRQRLGFSMLLENK